MALVLDHRRRLKAVGDLQDGMLRGGITLTGTFALSGQWDRILKIGPIGPVTRDDFRSVAGSDLGRFGVIINGLRSEYPQKTLFIEKTWL